MEMLIGRVVKSHGVRGEVAVELLADESEDHIVVGEVLTGRQTGKEIQLTVKTVRPAPAASFGQLRGSPGPYLGR